MTFEEATRALINALNDYGRPSPQWRKALRDYEKAKKRAAL